ncbi:error-prone DNA polymerase [Alcaligenes endophyticus]|uniref:Error-prone DNA polymerase n=1 Tax=Alcaligenes endophyticus TaxID=1929088 RepID=A0ABT8EJW8_9BURK|nr:error-prone DNA polymerase [Alcaligenes endophyticus]MCX5591895.1 error-prone DNA polymerase [Alcaligenes endophyticus]MDN4121584.1 error-prone DNA polymerase [Alcaligenes endophyticus]
MSHLLDYAELDCISNFSFLQGASHPEELCARAAKLGYQALALCDYASMAGVVRAHVAAQEHGIHLIIGTRFYWQEQAPQADELLCLATTQAGYSNLCQLITAQHQTPQAFVLQAQALAAQHKALSPSLFPDCLFIYKPAYARSAQHIQAQLATLNAFFPTRLYLGLCLHKLDQDSYHRQQIQLASAHSTIPVLPLGGVQMHVRSRQVLHDILCAIRHKQSVQQCVAHLRPNAEHHLRSRLQLANLYPPAMRSLSIALAQRCHFSLNELQYQYPQEVCPPHMSHSQYLRTEVWQGAQKRYPEGLPLSIAQRLDEELALIAELRYEAYFLTLYDIVNFARSRDILCQGRGSAANSAVCYCLGITEVDPASSRTLFARFISRARKEPPDIDVDFEHQRREEVIQYIYQKYGRHRAALAAVVIRYRRRSALRDVGKALGLPPDLIDSMAKSEHSWVRDRDLLTRLQETPHSLSKRQMLLWASLTPQLRDFPRHFSQHPGGFVIADTPLHHLVPIQPATMPERSIVQWDKDDLDAMGLLKVDILALGMLSALQRCLKLVSASLERPLRLQDIGNADAPCFAMIQAADTIGVFQIESRAQMSMLPRLKPKEYYDLVVQVAIVRPGPIQGGMVHPYLQRREHGYQAQYPNPALAHVLDRTLGVPIFQEQAMELAMIAASFTPDEADQLRRSMAAWRRRGGLAQMRHRLIDGMLANGYQQDFAERLFEQLSGFGEYGFPESHAASFARLAWCSAYLKCHYPAEFLAALLNSQPMGFYTPGQLIHDARQHGVQVLPVDALHSHWESHIQAPNTVRLGLNRIKGLAQSSAAQLVQWRTQAQHQQQTLTLASLRPYLDPTALQALAQAQALRSLSPTRRQALWDSRLSHPKGLLRHSPIHETNPAHFAPAGAAADTLSDYRSLGFSLDHHPVGLLRAQLQTQGFVSAQTLLNDYPDRRLARACGLVTMRQRPQTSKGTIFVTLEDETGHLNVIVRDTIAQRDSAALLQARLLAVYGTWQRHGQVCHLIALRLVDLSHLIEQLHTSSRDFH